MTKKEAPLDSCGFYHGLVYDYFNTGELSAIEGYKHGNRHGITKDYRRNGSLIYIANYINGKTNGLIKYYSNENLTTKCYFADHDIREGESILFDYNHF